MQAERLDCCFYMKNRPIAGVLISYSAIKYIALLIYNSRYTTQQANEFLLACGAGFGKYAGELAANGGEFQIQRRGHFCRALTQ